MTSISLSKIIYKNKFRNKQLTWGSQYSRNNIRLPDKSLNDIAYQGMKQAKLRFCLWKDMLWDEDFKRKTELSGRKGEFIRYLKG